MRCAGNEPNKCQGNLQGTRRDSDTCSVCVRPLRLGCSAHIGSDSPCHGRVTRRKLRNDARVCAGCRATPSSCLLILPPLLCLSEAAASVCHSSQVAHTSPPSAWRGPVQYCQLAVGWRNNKQQR